MIVFGVILLCFFLFSDVVKEIVGIDKVVSLVIDKVDIVRVCFSIVCCEGCVGWFCFIICFYLLS